MINWILRELEKQPTRLFYEKELESMDPHEFERLRQEKLLVYVQPDEKSETYGYGQAQPLTVMEINGQLFGIDEDNPEEDPVPLTKKDLARYSFALETFAAKLGLANNTSGSVSRIDRRMVFVGEKMVASQNVALILGMFDLDSRAEGLLLTLHSRLPTGFAHFVVATPSFNITAVPLKVQLERLRIHLVPLNAESLAIDMSSFAKKTHSPALTAVLTPEREEEFQARGYKCRLPIVVTGDIGKWGLNNLTVNGFPVPLGNTSLIILLRLIVQLLKTDTGKVTKSGLRSAGYLTFGGEEQAVSRLRAAFTGVLGELSPHDLIQSYGCGAIRLSTHPALVRYDKDKLARHRNDKVRRLAAQLP